MKLRQIAYSRAGDKGDICNVCVFPYSDDHWELVRQALTVERVTAFFGDLVKGPIERYELPGSHGLNFVMRSALAGGVSSSLRVDPHGKAFQSLILDIEIDENPSATESPGTAIRRQVQGSKSDALQNILTQLDTGLAAWGDDFVFGKVWARPGLLLEERLLVAIVALAANKNVDQLRTYLHGALQAGVSVTKIQESLVMLVVYAGFPVAISALATWRDVLESARRAGTVLNDA